MLADHGLEISALSNHLSSQMVLPFSDASLDEWAGTSDKEEMVKLGREHILKTARVASELGDRDRRRLLRLDGVGELVHLAAVSG